MVAKAGAPLAALRTRSLSPGTPRDALVMRLTLDRRTKPTAVGVTIDRARVQLGPGSRTAPRARRDCDGACDVGP